MCARLPAVSEGFLLVNSPCQPVENIRLTALGAHTLVLVVSVNMMAFVQLQACLR
jgi:hypothetical protein